MALPSAQSLLPGKSPSLQIEIGLVGNDDHLVIKNRVSAVVADVFCYRVLPSVAAYKGAHHIPIDYSIVFYAVGSLAGIYLQIIVQRFSGNVQKVIFFLRV